MICAKPLVWGLTLIPAGDERAYVQAVRQAQGLHEGHQHTRLCFRKQNPVARPVAGSVKSGEAVFCCSNPFSVIGNVSLFGFCS